MSESKLEVAFNEEYTGDRESPEWKPQLELPYPQELHDSGCGYMLQFYTNGVSTYHETLGEYNNAGPWLARGKLYTDFQLYEIAVDWFKCTLEMQAEAYESSP
tara:strand:+ start:1596 stop:1904 length:309 start_codon:yes stop_codon:yes gene_type:complete